MVDTHKESISELSKIVGSNMKRIVDEAGDTQESAEAKLGIEQSMLSRYFNGKSNVSLEVMSVFSDKYGVPITALVEGKGQLPGGGLDSEKLSAITTCVDLWLTAHKLWMTPEDKAKAISFLYAQNAQTKETVGLALSALRAGNSESFNQTTPPTFPRR
jgi:transcriptional regulator with XRE-family HTH domain